MSESKNQDTIASRVKDRSKVKDRPGRVGGEEHRKLVMRRKREHELKKSRSGRNVEC
jgi:hypothetical protein|tara:strand:- start:58 stop:228 length:171 start_codon:yes stop_codon:yes gene_type:complete